MKALLGLTREVNNMDDLRIIELYFERDEQAIKETDAKYGKLCHSIAYNILNNHEASEECVNDTYVGAWNAIPPTRPSNFMSFVCKIARNSFTITSETLGVYKVAMYVTVDGYLWTNAFNYQYLFNIGEDAASKIIKYAKENSTEAEYEPYQNTIVGKITEITDEYILLDDSILCANPDDGITYKILLNDLRISRYAESGAIRVGENVQITYEGEIDESNTIDSAISASDVVISGGDVLIPE